MRPSSARIHTMGRVAGRTGRGGPSPSDAKREATGAFASLRRARTVRQPHIGVIG